MTANPQSAISIPEHPQSSELVSVSQVARRLGVHVNTASKYLATLEVEGHLPGHIGASHGKRWFWADVLAALRKWSKAG